MNWSDFLSYVGSHLDDPMVWLLGAVVLMSVISVVMWVFNLQIGEPAGGANDFDINPASGLPGQVGGYDVGGNLWGFKK